MSGEHRASNSGHEDLALKVRASGKVWATVSAILLALFGSGGVAYTMSDATREASEVSARLAQQQVDNAVAEQQLLRERICVLERELMAEVAARVSLSAADAERDRSKKAQAAAEAVRRFEETAEDWPCPATADDRAKRTRRPLSERAANSISTRPPSRR